MGNFRPADFRLIAATLLLFSVATGCCSGVHPHNLHVVLGSGLANTDTKIFPEHDTVEVHVIAVNQSDYGQWKTMDMNDYWQDGSSTSLRNSGLIEDGTIKVLHFRNANSSIVLASDPFWAKQSNGYMYLFVLSNTPASVPARAGNDDPRRRIFPLDCKVPDTIELQLNPSGWVTLTPPKAD